MPLRELELTGPSCVRRAVGAFGRTEDVQFSPDNRRLAIAGFGRDRVFLLEVEISGESGAPSVEVTGLTELTSSSLCEPHGLCFLDDDTVVVANRGGEAPLFALPPPADGLRQVAVDPLATIRAGDEGGLATPGSVEAWALAPDLYEVVVCNNYADNVSRHLVDVRDGCRVLGSEVLLAAGLAVPDGVTVSRDRRWIAVSNHNTHSVLAFRATPDLASHSRPDAVLCGVSYPHGLRFTEDGSHLVVADAGAPCIHVFAAEGGDWHGDHQPDATLDVMDAETFERGRYNPQEGGPKGLDLDRTSSVLAVTSEHLPLGLFDARDVVPTRPPARSSRPSHPDAGSRGSEAARVALLREVARASGLEGVAAAQEAALARLSATRSAVEARVDAQAAELQRAHAEVEALRLLVDDGDRRLAALHRSTSWRATAVPRWLGARLRRGAARRG